MIFVRSIGKRCRMPVCVRSAEDYASGASPAAAPRTSIGIRAIASNRQARLRTGHQS